MMAVARTLLEEGDTTRRLYLYDTYRGMSEPGEIDRDLHGVEARELMNRYPPDADGNRHFCYAGLEEVRANLASTGYPQGNIEFVKGRVEETIPGVLPESIALLRLDTDWYFSTAHELKHLFPLIVEGGVLILDDYGHWQGARRAADEFFELQGWALLLNRIDYTGRIAVVTSVCRIRDN